MNMAENLNLVHESEVQRQYARVKLPVELTLDQAGVVGSYDVVDLSAGGFSFTALQGNFSTNKHYRGSLKMNIDGFLLTMDVKFQVKSHTSDKRIGCEFQGLGPSDVAALRYIITSFLNGELVSVGDMLNTLSRDNHAKARNKAQHQPTLTDKVKAVGGTLAFLCLGIAAIAFMGMKLYQEFFVIESLSGKLVIDDFRVTMPRDGTVKPLVSVGDKVAQGAPIATFEAPVLDYLNSELGQVINTGQLDLATKATIKGTLTSPCNCVVNEISQSNGFTVKGTQIFELVSDDSQPYVNALFPIGDAEKLMEAKNVDVELVGNAGKLTGTVSRLEVLGDGLNLATNVVARIDFPVDAVSGKTIGGYPLGHPVIVSVK